MLAATSLLIVVLIGVLAGRLGALALLATGVPHEIARFQARSALTGCGFTTSESEQLVNHPVRRRIVKTLMLAGNAGLVTIAGTVMLSFATSGSTGDALTRAAIILVGVGFIVRVMHAERVEGLVTRLLTRLLNRYSDLELRDHRSALRLTADYEVHELALNADD